MGSSVVPRCFWAGSEVGGTRSETLWDLHECQETSEGRGAPRRPGLGDKGHSFPSAVSPPPTIIGSGRLKLLGSGEAPSQRIDQKGLEAPL